MNKETIARDINCIATYATRTIGIDRVEYKEDDIITVEKAESWAYNNDSSFSIENSNYNYELLFACYNLPCHEVDYDNEEEVEILNAAEGEGEVLVPAGTKFKVTYVSTDDDRKEMGYYQVDLEVVK